MILTILPFHSLTTQIKYEEKHGIKYSKRKENKITQNDEKKTTSMYAIKKVIKIQRRIETLDNNRRKQRVHDNRRRVLARSNVATRNQT